MNQEEWVKVFQSPMLHQATIVQSILKENDIEAVILNQQDSSYITIGEIKVYVAPEDSAKAISIIEQSFPVE